MSTPVTVSNRPGLPVIAYRVGSHASFLATMKARLSSAAHAALGSLRTREEDDFSIALLDAWATLADVLTFYQERIATEAYLRTATERFSVLELARLVGYAPRPGVAASVHLAYTLDPGSALTIPKGSRVQSVPGPGEQPQTFETSESLEARAELNVLRPRVERPQYLTLEWIRKVPYIHLAGTATGLRVNDVLLLQHRTETDPSLFQVIRLAEFVEQDRTEVAVVQVGPTSAGPEAAPALKRRLRDIARRYDAASKFGVSPGPARAGRDLLAQLGEDVADEELIDRARRTIIPRLKELRAAAAARRATRVAAWLSAAVADLETALATPTPEPAPVAVPAPLLAAPEGTSVLTQIVRTSRMAASQQPRSSRKLERDETALFGPQSDLIPRLYNTILSLRPDVTYGVLAQVVPQPTSPLESIEVLRVRAALFGHNLSPRVTFSEAGKPQLGYLPSLDNTWDLPDDEPTSIINLDAVHDQIKVDSRIAIRRPLVSDDDVGSEDRVVVGWAFSIHDVLSVETQTLTAHGVSSRVTVLGVSPKWPPLALDKGLLEFYRAAVALRSTTVFAQNEPLALAGEPIVTELTGDEEYLELDGLYRGLEAGRLVIVEGERTDLLPAGLRLGADSVKQLPSPVVDAELAMIAEVVHRTARAPDGVVGLPGDAMHTFIRFARRFNFRFKRDTARIYANVVEATHGDTKVEVLGHGDATRTFQTFPLKQPPLTYVAAPTAKGAETTLEVRVNEVLWKETAHHAGLGPNDRRYVIRIDDDGKTSVVFGNGRQGARLPTGIENVRGRYRSGIGKAGNVAARQISLLLSKPLGVKEVVNPLGAGGGADRETRDQARQNAPKGTQALDRLVSVADYADFAETFAGIAKASAAELSDGRQQLVHVTIAGADDIPIAETSDLFQSLRQALHDLGDPHQAVELATRELLLLVVKARVRVLPDYSFELVEPRLREAMVEAFGFDRRALAQDVLQAEVLGVLQAVPGVAYVDLDVLAALGERDLAKPDPSTSLGGVVPRIRVRPARPREDRQFDESAIAPAQLAVLRGDVRDTLMLSEIR